MIGRYAGRTIQRLAEGYPAIVVTGPRPSGETTVARALVPSLPCVSLDGPAIRLLATDDPRLLLHASIYANPGKKMLTKARSIQPAMKSR